ncbi:MAG: bifunctional phosphoribosylaminoimidazolecarboxamide formyltransferase/IMP cyclohydrolase, partial [Trichodesmium sp. St11_bin5]|nr:bifunctional phosphoribosylaminoimidazolecarboxamide formyltransferase/IMP cyclohydrolase [Trichodesmium sp. St11_bin5]
TLAEAIEKIDIGGPAMLRASAKNFAHLTVLCNHFQYNSYLEELRKNAGEVSLEFRQKCALAGFKHTATYDQAIATYLQEQQTTSESEKSEKEIFFLSGKKIKTLRYGENPHQYATWYQRGINASGWGASKIIQGKELSYNNLVDLEAARRIIIEFSDAPTVAILKHTNPCGVAVDETILAAYERAFAGDSVSAFGGIVALNKSIDAATAKAMTKTFLECVVAPGCEPEAEKIFKSKSKLRVLISPYLKQSEPETIKVISGGFLVQDTDDTIDNYSDWKIVTEKQPTTEQIEELMFAWKVVKHVKSNAIVVTKNRATVGIGAGQMNRVGAVKIALEQAGEKAIGGVLASDAFFPFDDSVKTAAAAGVTAIIQPGGSLKDKDSIAAANELGLIMILTGIRHFLH